MQSHKTVADAKKQGGRWSKEEHERFMLGLMQYGKNWKKIEQIVETRSGSQVRSHAQKFFNKIQKSSENPKSKKDRKINHNSRQNNEDDVSLSENNDMIRSLDDDNSLATPLEIISIIKKQSVDNRKIHLSSLKKSLEQNQQKHNKLRSTAQNKKFSLQLTNKNTQPNNDQLENLSKLNSFKSMNNILSAYEALNEADPENRFEDQSFLIGITKKYKKYFSKGGHFQNLIDFGNPHEVAKAVQMERSIRKKSWTLAEGIQGDENDLQDIKNKLKGDRIEPQPQNQNTQNKAQDLKRGEAKSSQKIVANDKPQDQNVIPSKKITNQEIKNPQNPQKE